MKAIVWSKDNCPFCVRAKSLLESKGIEYEERKIGQEWSKEQLLDVVPNARTVPQIFLDEKHIGGCTDLEEHFRNLT